MDETKLESLKVIILDHGEKVRVFEVEDPRDTLIRKFNALGQVVGLTAEVFRQPIASATIFAFSVCAWA